MRESGGGVSAGENDENGVGEEGKKSLGNFNNFGGGRLASARAGT